MGPLGVPLLQRGSEQTESSFIDDEHPKAVSETRRAVMGREMRVMMARDLSKARAKTEREDPRSQKEI
jgi:hypothetical protein